MIVIRWLISVLQLVKTLSMFCDKEYIRLGRTCNHLFYLLCPSSRVEDNNVAFSGNGPISVLSQKIKLKPSQLSKVDIPLCCLYQ